MGRRRSRAHEAYSVVVAVVEEGSRRQGKARQGRCSFVAVGGDSVSALALTYAPVESKSRVVQASNTPAVAMFRRTFLSVY